MLWKILKTAHEEGIRNRRFSPTIAIVSDAYEGKESIFFGEPLSILDAVDSSYVDYVKGFASGLYNQLPKIEITANS